MCWHNLNRFWSSKGNQLTLLISSHHSCTTLNKISLKTKSYFQLLMLLFHNNFNKKTKDTNSHQQLKLASSNSNFFILIRAKILKRLNCNNLKDRFNQLKQISKNTICMSKYKRRIYKSKANKEKKEILHRQYSQDKNK